MAKSGRPTQDMMAYKIRYYNPRYDRTIVTWRTRYKEAVALARGKVAAGHKVVLIEYRVERVINLEGESDA